jgi:ABC-type uncharacterized transport system substrate-binding protein
MLTWTGVAAAHPHVWVDAASEIVFNDEGRIVAVRHHWRFDEVFSSFATMGLDTDGDGVLTREELQPLAEVNVESLSEFGFFTFMTVGDYRAGFGEPRDYWLEDHDGQLTLHFTLPLARPLSAGQPVRLQVYDPEYFVAFEVPSEEAIRLADAPTHCELKVRLAQELDPAAAAALAVIGPDQRELPPELRELTEDLDNSATISCPSG